MNTLSTHNALNKIQRSLTFGMRMALGALISSSLSATAATWNTTVDFANWGTASNWTLPSAVPNAVDAEAIFGDVITGNSSVLINGNFTVGQMTFDNNNSQYFFTAFSPQTLTFDVSSGNASINTTSGDHRLGNINNTGLTIVLADNLEVNNNGSSGFTIAALITGNRDIIHSGSAGGHFLIYGPNPHTLSGSLINNAGRLSIGLLADGNQEFNNLSSVDINGGTVALGSESEDLNASANLNLNGGTLELGAVTQTFQNLTLSNHSLINMSPGGVQSSILNITGTVNHTGSEILTIKGWGGSLSGGGSDRIIFGTSLSSAFLSNVLWSQQGIMGARQLASGEIVPIPEPGSILGGMGLAALAVAYEIRRRRQKAVLPVQES